MVPEKGCCNPEPKALETKPLKVWHLGALAAPRYLHMLLTIGGPLQGGQFLERCRAVSTLMDALTRLDMAWVCSLHHRGMEGNLS